MQKHLIVEIALISLALGAVATWFVIRRPGSRKTDEGNSSIAQLSFRSLTFGAALVLLFAVGTSMYFIHAVIGLHLAYWIVPVFGALGGLVGSLIRSGNYLTLVTFDQVACRVRLGFIGDIILGLGGAAVVAFLFENTLNFDPQKQASYPLMISVCFIAGVFGQLLIEMAGEKVLAKEALALAKSAQKDTHELKTSASSAFVIASLYKYDKGLYDEALKAAEEALESDPTNVRATVAKARALKKLGKINDALVVTNEALQSSRVVLAKEDRGTLLYNKACYTLLLNPQAVDETLGILKQAFELRPNIGELVRRDPDMEAIWSNETFLQLTGQK